MTAFPGDYVKVKNNSTAPLTLTWDGRSVNIKPNSVGLATFEQVANSFGNPFSGAKDGVIKDEYGNIFHVNTRQQEVDHVRNKWGENVTPPSVEVYDQDDNRIYTPAEDPLGEHQAVAVTGPINQQDQIARMEHQLALMKKEFAAANSPDLTVPGVTPPTSDTETTDDLPTDE